MSRSATPVHRGTSKLDFSAMNRAIFRIGNSMNFSDFGLIEPLIRAVSSQGYTTPSPIQRGVISLVLQGKDVMASAQTGTGKTAAFVLPVLQILNSGSPPQSRRIRTLILTPTRELAAQICSSVETYGKFLNLSSAAVFGGVNINPQMRKLRKGVDVLVATPGRLLDLHQQQAVRFDDIEIFVLDEADRMLDMGFIHDIKRIRALLPKSEQNLMFSATFSKEIRELAKTMLDNPVEVDVASRNTAVKTVKQILHPVDKKRKSRLLAFLIDTNSWSQVLVFNKTKHGANKLVRELNKWEIRATVIHGGKSQMQRTKALADFKRGKVDVLVATDIAARGIDIHDLPHVVNFDLPFVAEDYVHRIGRTGRAGKSGAAVSLVCADEIKQLRDIERLIRIPIERVEVEGFEPSHQLPETCQNFKGDNSRSKKRTSKKRIVARFDNKSKPGSNRPRTSKKKPKSSVA